MNEGDGGDPSAEVRDGMAVLEQQEAKLAALLKAIEEGERSGPSKPFDLEAFIASKRAAVPKS